MRDSDSSWSLPPMRASLALDSSWIVFAARLDIHFHPFFSPLCDVCRRELRTLDEVAQVKDGTVVIAAISILGVSETDGIIGAVRPSYPVLLDRDAVFTRILGGGIVPVLFAVDARGYIDRVAIGEQTADQLRALAVGLSPLPAADR